MSSVEPLQKTSRPLSIAVKSISQTGIINIQFSEPLVVPLEFSKKSKSGSVKGTDLKARRKLGTIDESIIVRVIPGNGSDVT